MSGLCLVGCQHQHHRYDLIIRALQSRCEGLKLADHCRCLECQGQGFHGTLSFPRHLHQFHHKRGRYRLGLGLGPIFQDYRFRDRLGLGLMAPLLMVGLSRLGLVAPLEKGKFKAHPRLAHKHSEGKLPVLNSFQLTQACHQGRRRPPRNPQQIGLRRLIIWQDNTAITQARRSKDNNS